MKTAESATRLRAFFASTYAWSWAYWLLSPAVNTVAVTGNDADVRGQLRPQHGGVGGRKGWRAGGPAHLARARYAVADGLKAGLALVFLLGTSQTHIPLALFMLSVVAMSVVFAWLVNRGGRPANRFMQFT